MNNEQYITLKTAKLAKKAGFNEKTFGFYYLKHPKEKINVLTFNKSDSMHYALMNWNSDSFLLKDEVEYVSAPTKCQLQNWLREEYGIIINIDSYYTHNYDIIIHCYEIDCKSYSSMDTDQYWKELTLSTEEKTSNKLKYYGTNYYDIFERALQDALEYLINNKE